MAVLDMVEHDDALFIDGTWNATVDGNIVEITSPATREVVGRSVLAGPADVARAIEAARRAFDSGPWPRTTLEERIAVLERLAELLSEHTEQFGVILTGEVGSPMTSVARDQAEICAAVIRTMIKSAREFEWATRREGPQFPTEVRRLPVGVVGAIVAWNYPLTLAIAKVTPALLSGCTVVLKPASETPLSARLLAQLAAEAGVPNGVLNVVPADREVSELIVKSPLVDKIAFTGSTAAGRRIAALCGEQLKRCTLELGGKSPAIVLADTDLDVAMPGLAPLTMLNNGQTCHNLTRVFAPRSRYDEVVESISATVNAFKVGDPLDPETEIGPVLNQRQFDRVHGYIESGRAAGARLVTGGGRPAGLDTGYYIQPTVFADVDNSMVIARDEIFGPVVCVIPFESEEDAIRLANDTHYGLAASVWSSDPEHAKQVGYQLRSGTLGINGWGIDLGCPFGGFKESGIGREFGPEGLSAYSELQSVALFDEPGTAA